MSKKKEKKETLIYASKKDRIDRTALSETIFDSFLVAANQVDTTILLLNSIEDKIILEVLRHLDGSKRIENYQILYDKHILKLLLGHCESSHLYIRRFAMKILSQMFHVDQAKEELLQNRSCFQITVDNYIEIEDNFLNEYAAIILNYLWENANFSNSLIANENFVQIMLQKICQTNDSDVLWNTLELLLKFLNNSDGFVIITFHVELPFEFLVLSVIQNEYPMIQNRVLDVLAELVRSQNPALLERIRDRFFMDTMFGVLENESWKELHGKAIETIRRSIIHKPIAEFFYKEIYLDNFFKFIEITDDLKLKSISVLAELAEHSEPLEVLFEHKFIDHLMVHLKAGGNYIVARGIKNMVYHKLALKCFLEHSTVPLLFDLFNNIEKLWLDRNEGGRALNALFSASRAACLQTLECDGVTVITNIFNVKFKYKEEGSEEELQSIQTTEDNSDKSNSMDGRFIAVKMLTILGKYPEIRKKILNKYLAKCLSTLFKKSVECPVLMCELSKCLMTYIGAPKLQNSLIDQGFSYSLICCLKRSDVPILRSAVTDFISAAAKFELFCLHLIESQVLYFLIKDKNAILHCPNWSKAIESILSNYLPVKFALRGHLDMCDITKEMFYATNQIWKDPRQLYVMFNNECSPIFPIILCNFEHLSPDDIAVDAEEICIESTCYNRKPFDGNLPEYLKVLKNTFEIRKIPLKSIKNQSLKIEDVQMVIQILAEFVCTKICCETKSPYSVCWQEEQGNSLAAKYNEKRNSDDQTEIEQMIKDHMKELKHYFHSNIIPLGSIKFGTYFERSLLFKVLADRIGLLCSLHMCQQNCRIGWNEVFIPLYGKEPHCGDINPPAYPNNPTHIVDLMHHPGNLYAIGCQLALKYLQKPV